MNGGKSKFDYKRPDSTGHFHFRRKVGTGKKAGQWIGCPFGASKDEGILPSALHPRTHIDDSL